MTKEAFILHDALDYIDTATHKAALALEYVADYFDPDPIDHDRIRAEQAAIRTLVNISLDYLTQIKREYTEAMNRTAHTPSAAPLTAEQAAERIQYISIEDATDSTATAYKAAILQWVNDNEPETPAQYMTFALAYAAGLQEGKRQERERRKNRQSEPET